MTKNTVLIIGAVWVTPTASAAGSRMLQLIQLFLAQNWQLTFASPSQKGEKTVDLNAMGVAEVSIELNNTSFDDFVRTLQPTIVLFDRFMTEEQFGWRIAENCPEALRVLDTEDLHCLRKTRQEAIRKGQKFSTDDLLGSDIAKREIASILRSDLSLIISTYEMELLENVFKVDKGVCYYIPFLLDAIDDTSVNNWKSFEDREHFAMIGNFLHAPNVDAVLVLKKSIWKAIREQLPKAELHIYGAYAPQQILELHNEKEGFLIKGYIPNSEEAIGNTKVVLAPLRFGAGIKGKLTEAMICGTPSVTTPIGAEGMHDNLPWSGCIADDIDDFANKAIKLYTNKSFWEESQKNGIEIINQIYDKKKIGIPFIKRIEDIQQNLETHRARNFTGSLLQYHRLQSTKYMSKWIEEKNRKK